MEDLRSLPGLELLHEGVSSIYYNEEEDEFIRADQGPYGNSRKLLLKQDGQPLFDASKYEHINDFNAKTGATIPLKRVGTADDVAAAIIACCTSMRYATGSIFVADGGRSL